VSVVDCGQPDQDRSLFWVVDDAGGMVVVAEEDVDVEGMESVVVSQNLLNRWARLIRGTEDLGFDCGGYVVAGVATLSGVLEKMHLSPIGSISVAPNIVHGWLLETSP